MLGLMCNYLKYRFLCHLSTGRSHYDLRLLASEGGRKGEEARKIDPSFAGGNFAFEQDSQGAEATSDHYHHYHGHSDMLAV